MPILLDAGPSERGWHRLENFRRCPSLFAYRYLLKVPLAASDALIRGSLVHIILAHHYARLKQRQLGKDPELYYAPVIALRLAAEKLADEFKSKVPLEYIPGLTPLADAYEATYFNERWKVLYVEEPFRANVGPKNRLYTARIDLIVEDSAGRVIICDHKSAARPDQRTVDSYSLSGQFMGLNLFGQKLFGQRFGGTLINFISGEEPPFKFSREPPHPAPYLLSRFKDDVEYTEARIDELAASGIDPWHYPRTMSDVVCVHRYGRCDAYALCQWGPSQAAALAPVDLTINFGSGVKENTP